MSVGLEYTDLLAMSVEELAEEKVRLLALRAPIESQLAELRQTEGGTQSQAFRVLVGQRKELSDWIEACDTLVGFADGAFVPRRMVQRAAEINEAAAGIAHVVSVLARVAEAARRVVEAPGDDIPEHLWSRLSSAVAIALPYLEAGES